MKISFLPILTCTLALLSHDLLAADAPKPLKILLVAGGGYHDYTAQKEILKKGIEERVNATVDVQFVPTSNRETRPALPLYGKPDYANGYDLVIHDECAADINDPAVIQGVLKPHQDGTPGVNIHCAMHSYRFGDYSKPVDASADNGKWYEYLGLQSSGHGPQHPIDVHFVKDQPAVKGLEDWTTGKEELYNNVHIHGGITLAKGVQTFQQKKKGEDGSETVEEKKVETVVAWTNLYKGKTRVWSTTLGHNNFTVQDERFLNLVARGILWATDKLNDDGTAVTGYGPGGK